MKTGTVSILPLLVGVAILRVATLAEDVDQSETSVNQQAILDEDVYAGKRNIDTPEVVLQLKYDGGELNRIYLAQFRKGQREWVPSVPARTNLCSDLCSAGLGGDTCGAPCQELLPVGLRAALQGAPNASESYHGHPRTAVCPTLCANRLGEPLCNCHAQEHEEPEHTDWAGVCRAFCVADRYILGGCPTCEMTTPETLMSKSTHSRILTTNDGWFAWCDVQCRLGQGGAACNCDKAPFQ
ncbi:hypothetical protein JYU34_001312 [Plutella xylostella]|uniref:Uncharacterized protein n=2 Tax=Plutella xylostella TaxID=51655 RepID=A0ABQ7R6J3_PLUXY|nr:hypothetical protein JYU34_001312 [Plutella xylostella]CAG9133625.1 unnamed protein product [Plutella xylostella]